MSKKYKLP